MPFDLSSAQEAPAGAFDLGSAQPVGGTSAPTPAAPKAQATKTPPTTVADAAGAVLEPAMAFGTGMLAKPVSDVAGLYRLGLEGLRRAGVPGIEERDPLADKQAVQRALTYEPRTGPGKAVTGALSLPGELLSKGAGKVEEAIGRTPILPPTISGPLGSGVREAIEQAPALLGAKGGAAAKAAIPERQAALDIAKSRNAPRDVFRAQAQEAGLVTPPEGTSWLAGIPGMQKIDRYLSGKNAPEFDRLIADNFGLPKGTALSDEVLKSIRSKEGAVYEDVVQASKGEPVPVTAPATQVNTGIIGPDGQPIMRTVPGKTTMHTPGLQLGPEFSGPLNASLAEIEAKIQASPETFKSLRPSVRLLREWGKKAEEEPRAAMDAIKQLRSDATTNFRSTDPGQRALGFTRMEIANRIEDAFERHLETHQPMQKPVVVDGVVQQAPDLMTRFRQARQKIAQTYDVEKVIDESGRVNAQKLYAISQRRPLTGNLDLVARFAGEFPGAARKAVGKQGISPYDWMFVVGSAAARHPLAALTELAGRVGIPMLAERGMLQKGTPSYQVGPGMRSLPIAAPAAGAAISYPPIDQ